MRRKWINLRDLSAAGEPDERDDYQKSVDNKHNKGRPRDRIGRFNERGDDRPGQRDRADDRDEQDEADGDERNEDVDRA